MLGKAGSLGFQRGGIGSKDKSNSSSKRPLVRPKLTCLGTQQRVCLWPTRTYALDDGSRATERGVALSLMSRARQLLRANVPKLFALAPNWHNANLEAAMPLVTDAIHPHIQLVCTHVWCRPDRPVRRLDQTYPDNVSNVRRPGGREVWLAGHSVKGTHHDNWNS